MDAYLSTNRIKINLFDIICIIIIALQFDFFYLISTEFKLGQALLLGLSLLILFWKINKKVDFKNINAYLFFFLFLLMITGAYQVSKLFGGGFISAFLAERVLWAYIPFYFALEKLFRRRILTIKKVKEYLLIVGIIQLLLYFAQWAISDKIIFLHVLSGERYGSARFYMSPILLIFWACFCVSDLYNGKRISALWILLVYGEILVVQKFRMTTVALTLAIIGGFFLYKGNLKREITIFMIGIIAVIVILNTRMGRDIVASLSNMGNDNSLRGRDAWRHWALDELRTRPLLGNGFVYSAISYEYGAQYVSQLYGWSFTPGDYGIMGFIYQYGILGAIWFIMFIVIQLRRCIVVWKYKKNYSYIVFLLFIIIDSYSELYWLMSNGIFVLVFFIVMLEFEYKTIQETTIPFRHNSLELSFLTE